MLRSIFFILILLALATLAAGVANHPGALTLEWFNYRVETSAAFLLLGIPGIVLLLWLSFSLLAFIVTVPGKLGKSRHTLQQEKGLQALTEAFIALSEQDPLSARKYIATAEKYLPDPTLPHLLNLQISRQQGDEEGLKAQFKTLEALPQTRPLALRGFIEEARRDNRMDDALNYTEELLRLRPKHKASLLLAMDLYSYHHRWQEALQLISQGQKRLLFRSQEAKYLAALIYTEQALNMLAMHNTISAMEMLRAALKKEPGFVPAACALAVLYQNSNKASLAASVLKRAWAISPHPQLAELYEKNYHSLPPEKRLKKIQELVKSNEQAWESLIAVGKAAITAKNWSLARTSLNTALARRKTSALCATMAELEQQEKKDAQKALYWMEELATALPDSAWHCQKCGTRHSQWNAHCTSCNAFDSIGWKPPHYAAYSLTPPVR